MSRRNYDDPDYIGLFWDGTAPPGEAMNPLHRKPYEEEAGSEYLKEQARIEAEKWAEPKRTAMTGAAKVTPEEAEEWLYASPDNLLDVEWGTSAEDPAGYIEVFEEYVLSTITRGWSTGVVEIVCDKHARFLAQHLLGCTRIIRTTK